MVWSWYDPIKWNILWSENSSDERLIVLFWRIIGIYINLLIHGRCNCHFNMQSNELDITIHLISPQLSGDCDVISNRLWCHQQDVNQSGETWPGQCVKMVVFIAIYGFIMSWLPRCSLLQHCNTWLHSLKSLWPSDAIWRQRSGSTLAQVMACWPMAPGHYLKQCWVTIKSIKEQFVGECKKT